MNRSNVKTYRYRVGKNRYLVINIHQHGSASATTGNVLVSNAIYVQILRKACR
jgi:hypothetical protein